MSRELAAQAFAQQARACSQLGSPLYAALLERVADDIRDGGPCARAVMGYERAPQAAAVPLRLLGAVHALALTGRAPEVAAGYPSAGGVFDQSRPAAAWPAFREAVAKEADWIRDWMTRPPQTNEVGRAGLLVAGLLYAVPTPQLPVRLFELGASAGLNLRADQFHYAAAEFDWGPPDSPVQLTDIWRDAVPPWLSTGARTHERLRVVERRGCDVSPIDPLSAEGSLALRAYLWPDQTARMRRLDGALRVAAKVPATVESADAAEFLSGVELESGTITVVWHSIMRQYVPAAQWRGVRRELDRLARAATPEADFACLSFEPHPAGTGSRFRLSARLARTDERVLADAKPHGIPAWWPDSAP